MAARRCIPAAAKRPSARYTRIVCGRFTHASPDSVLVELGFSDPGAVLAPLGFVPSYNVAPGQPIICVVNREDEPVRRLRWGLIPHWADSPALGYKMINARGESLAQKPAFRDSYRRRRCLVVADGFYEWRREGKLKIPYYFHRQGGGGIAFAGVWTRWRPEGGSAEGEIASVAIVTAPSGVLVEPIHDRMPVIVAREDYRRWLEPGDTPPEALADILAHPDYRDVECYRVSRRVNRADSDGPELIEPGPAQQTLF